MRTIDDEYFDWLYKRIGGNLFPQDVTYHKLLARLHSIDFTYSLARDDDRFVDGIHLRYEFGEERDINANVIASFIDIRPCSVFEMMVALACRCENEIMWDPDYGDRTDEWFWCMIDSLGLYDMTDNNFDSSRVNDIVYRFLDREYEPTGVGGLFSIGNHQVDMRNLTIWQQMHLYLQERSQV